MIHYEAYGLRAVALTSAVTNYEFVLQARSSDVSYRIVEARRYGVRRVQVVNGEMTWGSVLKTPMEEWTLLCESKRGFDGALLGE